ncbi:hypothetical protein [Anaerohalosphaera lusitana]|uniref:hypothetical protein n=1 Tax=Anaerohalosphaera lusitana TaxID=1936003 RepID=UPI0011BA5AE5|nr:hypothetical protein [Anaerohalosphaera lusitana]
MKKSHLLLSSAAGGPSIEKAVAKRPPNPFLYATAHPKTIIRITLKTPTARRVGHAHATQRLHAPPNDTAQRPQTIPHPNCHNDTTTRLIIQAISF